MLRYFGRLEPPLHCVPVLMNWEVSPVFTIQDAFAIAADVLYPDCPTAADVAEVLTSGISDGMLPAIPRYHSLARIAARLPERTIRRMYDRAG